MLLKENKFSEAKEYSERAKKLVELFDLGIYNKYVLDLSLEKEKQDKEKTIEIIRNIINEASNINDFINSKLYTYIEFNKNNRMNKDEYKKFIKMSI